MRLGTPIDYLSSRGEPLRKDSVSWRKPSPPGASDSAKRVLMLVTVAFGLLTFFLPLVSIDPPVGGTNLWSAAGIVEQAYEGNLPAPICERCDEPNVRALVALPFLVTTVYGLLLLALIPISVPYASNSVATLAIFGGMGSLYLGARRATGVGFKETFYGNWPRAAHVHVWPLQFVLFGVMAVLFFVSNSEITIRRSSLPPSDSGI